MNSLEMVLDTRGYYCATVHGVSMMPLLADGRDRVYLEKPTMLHKYDVVLFRRKNGQLVLHRLLDIKGDRLRIVGDNDTVSEMVDAAQVIGVMREFTRKGKVYSVDALWYRAYSRLWCATPCFKVARCLIKRVANGVKRHLRRGEGYAK